MRKGIAKFTAFCLAAGMTIGQGGVVYYASPSLTLVGFGAKHISADTTDTTEETQNTEDSAADADASEASESEAVESAADAEETSQEAEEETVEIDTSMVGTTGFAQCEQYLNVRASGDAEGEVVGKIYDNGSMEILSVDENGWYYVRSGNVEGYVAGQFVATGSEAQEIAQSSGYTTAEVGAEVLNVRSDTSTDAEIVATVSGSSSIEVVEDQGDWVKVILEDGTYGYVSHDYVNTTTEYATGETLEEEQERLDEQWLEYLAEQAAAEYTEAAYTEPTYTESYDYSDTSYASTTDSSYYYDDSYDTAAAEAQAQAEAAQAAADAAYAEAQAAAEAAQNASYVDTSSLEATAQSLYAAYVTAQEAADAAVANGADEQTVNDTCAAAQSAYASYVAAQNAVDEAAAGIVSTQEAADAAQAAADEQAQAAAAAQAAAQAAQEAADAAAQEAAQSAAAAEAAQTASYEEPAYEETTTTETTSGESSAGASVASYAVQFVGNPYVWGGSSLTSGADCSGFTMAVYANFGVSLPHNAAEQASCGTAVSLDDLQPSDLIFYGDGISHVAMYIGGGQVVHASNPTNGILISNYTYRTPVCARRYL